jgi:hypothetical protein
MTDNADTLAARLLADPTKRPRILNECLRMIDDEVDAKGGLTGLAICQAAIADQPNMKRPKLLGDIGRARGDVGFADVSFSYPGASPALGGLSFSAKAGETIAAIKQAVSIPVLANGDIDSPQKAKAVLAATGADGLLIGRAAQGRPWIFREIEHYRRTGEQLPAPTLSEVEQILLEHLAALHAFYGDVMGVRIARKHVSWYLATLPGAKDFRAQFNRLDSTDAQCANVRGFFSERNNNGEGVAA